MGLFDIPLLISKSIFASKIKGLSQQIGRTQLVVSLCKKLGFNVLDDSFDSIYVHALVEYGIEYPNKEIFLAFFAFDQTKDCIKTNKSVQELHYQLGALLNNGGQGKIFLQLKKEHIQENVIIEEYNLFAKLIQKQEQKTINNNPALARNTEILSEIKEIVEELHAEWIKIEQNLPNQYDDELPLLLKNIDDKVLENNLFLKMLAEKIDKAKLSEKIIEQVANKIYNIENVTSSTLNINDSKVFIETYIENQSIKTNNTNRPRISDIYKERKEEKILLKTLLEHNILLLTGNSQCGKSELARKISTHFFDEGFEFYRTDDIRDVKRFFSVDMNNKIVILEDPFGHIETIRESESSRRRLEELIIGLNNHQKLIVTNRIEILLDMFGTTNIQDCKIATHEWKDMTITDKFYISSFWKYYASLKKVNPEIIQKISEGFENSENIHLLQIGQLVYLANEDSSKLSNPSYSELEHIARKNSKEIARDLKERKEKFAQILSVLSICANTIHSVSFSDIAYILSDINERLSFVEINDMGVLGEYSEYPKYQNPALTPSTLEAIEYFEEKQFIIDLFRKSNFAYYV